MGRVLSIIKYKKHEARLPAEYQEVEYLQSDTTAGSNSVIDTGFQLTNNSKIQTKMYILSAMDNFLYGARQAYTLNAFAAFNNWAPFGTDSGQSTSIIILPNIPCILEQSQDGMVVDGQTVYGYQQQTFTTPINCTIFNCQQGTTPGAYYKPQAVYARCYYFKISENDALIADLVPCYRKSDDEPGMYDLVNKVFKTNYGTGTFTVGQDVIYEVVKETILERKSTSTGTHALPATYQEVEYLQSSGTQYIDTGAIANSNTEITYKFKLSTLAAGGGGIIGAGREYNTTDGLMVGVYTGSLLGYAGGANNLALGTATTDLYTATLTVPTITLFDHNTTLIKTVNTGKTELVSPDRNIYLGSCNSNNSTLKLRPPQQIYYCKIKDGNTVTHEFIPCYRKSDNVAGMYDKTTSTFITNAGTGEFTVGQEVYPADRLFIVERRTN